MSQQLLIRRYTIFSILFLIGLLCLQLAVPSSTETKSLIDFNKETIAKIANHPYVVTVTSIYLILFLIGIVNLVIYAVTLLKKQPILEQISPRTPFLLSALDTSRLFFYIFFLLFLAQIVGMFYIQIGFDTNNLIVIFNFIVEISIVAILIRFLTKKMIGLSNNCGIPSIIKLYTALLPVLMLSLFLNSFIIKTLGIQPTTNPAIDLFLLLKNKFFIGLLILQIVVIAPIAEELLFRGLIFKLLREKTSFFVAATITSLVFSLIHRASLNILPLFVISFAFAYLYEKTQNIASPIILHAIHNTVNLFLLIGLKIGLNF